MDFHPETGCVVLLGCPKRLQEPGYALRVEAKVRVSHAPRRVNFMANTQRTTNYHACLMEYDIPDTQQTGTSSA